MEIKIGTNTAKGTLFDTVQAPCESACFVNERTDPALPLFKAGTKVDDIINSGKWQHACLAAYFDEDNDGIINEDESFKLETADVSFSPNEHKLLVKGVNRKMQIFEDFSVPKSDEYYSSGTIPVAVLDSFDQGDSHGTIVSNILKTQNPDIAITKYDYHNGHKAKAPTETIYCGSCHESGKTKMFIPYVNGLEMLRQDVIFFGKKYKAINLSLGVTMTYETINELCAKELKVKLTPENIAEYKSQIKEILWEKCRKNPDLTYTNTRTKEEINIRDALQEIEIFDSLDIPIYVAQSYKVDNQTKETFNLFSLINTAVTVEAGTENIRPSSSTNSFAVDEKTGKRRVTQGIVFTGECIDKNSTSFATPAFLANILKKQ